ncbi:MAG: tetratricopeptide repeat protein [Bacteroidota bacterium]
MKYTILLFLGLLFCHNSLLAQGEFTEEEVAYETQLIEANRAKLLGKAEEAITILRKLHREQSTNAAVAYELGRLVLEQGDKEEAIRFLKLAQKNDPANDWYVDFLGTLLDKEGRFQEGMALYQGVTERSTGDPEPFYKLAYFQLQNGNPDAALATYDDLQNRIGLNETIAQNKHHIYVGKGNKRQAVRILEELIATQPRNVAFQHLLADYYQSQGQREQATAVFKEILRLRPEDPKAQLALAGGNEPERNDLRFLQQLQPTFERTDVDLDLKVKQLVPVLTQVVETGDAAVADAALQLTDLMEQAHGGDAKPYAMAGDFYYHSARPKAAAVKYAEALDREENIFPVWEMRLRALYEIGAAQELYNTANDALDVFPNRAVVQYYFAVGADLLGRYEDALDAISLGTIMSGRDPALKAQIKALEGQVLANDGDSSGAQTALESALALDPAAPGVQRRYATYLRQQDKLLEAEQAIDKALTLTASNPYVLVEAAQITYAQERFSEASRYLEKAQTQGAQYWPTALELAGDTQFQLDQADAAVKFWQRAKDLGGDQQRLSTKITNRSL